MQFEGFTTFGRERERVGEREREMESQSSPAMRRYGGYYYDA